MAKAVIFHLDPEFPNVKRLKKVVTALEEGEVIIYPTDTVYGMGCDLRKKKAIDRIRSIKGLGDKHLMSFICSDLSQAASYVNIDNQAFNLLKRILPGPYTVILEASSEVPKKSSGRERPLAFVSPIHPWRGIWSSPLERPLSPPVLWERRGSPYLILR